MEQKIDAIKKYKIYGRLDGFFNIKNVPPGIAEKLMTGWPNVDPEDTQNVSPTMKKMVQIAKKYKGKLEGHVISVKSHKPDARISFEGFTITIPDKAALQLMKSLKPDEFSKIKGKWRFWWD